MQQDCWDCLSVIGCFQTEHGWSDDKAICLLALFLNEQGLQDKLMAFFHNAVDAEERGEELV